MTNTAVRRAAATSILALACFGTAAPVATAAPVPTSQTIAVVSTAPALAYGYGDCRRAAATTTNMRMKVLQALADPACRQWLEGVARITIHDGGAFAARICARAQQPDGFAFQLMIFFISGGRAMTCSPY